jgi:membrane protein implicated in regulation of membrane protease activity
MVVLTAIWSVIGVVFGLVAARSKTVSQLPMAAAAALAAISALLGVGLMASLFVFALVALIGRWVVEPVVRSRDAEAARVSPGVGTLVGEHATVVERVSNDEGIGCVRVANELWSARTQDDEPAIPVGAEVTVVELRGATAIVQTV